MAERVPTRIRVAVDAVDPGPDARLLEVGCGPGVAMALVCRRLDGGHVTGLDRSPTAIERAQRRLAPWLDAGVADLQHRELAAFHGDGRPFDVVYGVDVTLFWTRPAPVEAARLRDLVAGDGVVRLFFSAPPGADGRRAAEVTAEALAGAGFGTAIDVVDGVGCVAARPRS